MKTQIIIFPLEWVIWPVIERWWTEPVFDHMAHDRGEPQKDKGGNKVRRINLGPIRVLRDPK